MRWTEGAQSKGQGLQGNNLGKEGQGNQRYNCNMKDEGNQKIQGSMADKEKLEGQWD